MILIALLFWLATFFIIIESALRFQSKLLSFLISVIITACVLSYTYSLALFIGLNFNIYQLIFTLIPLLILLSNYKRVSTILSNLRKIKIKKLDIIIVLLCFLVFTAAFFHNSTRWGNWDAWAIWSLHAKFLIYNPEYLNLFTNDISWTHPDYPLMLSTIIASIWKSLNSQSALVPLLVSYGTSITVVLLVMSSFLEAQRKLIGIIALVVISSAIFLADFGSLQYSDTLFGLFLLASIVLYNHLTTEKYLVGFILLGFVVASAAWVKNEGIVFLIVFFVLFVIHNRNSLTKNILFFIIGTIIPLLFILYFKTQLAPSNDLIANATASTMDQLTDLSRYSLIIDYFLEKVVYVNPLLIIAILSAIIIDASYCKTLGFQVLMALVIAYFIVYVLTYLELDWHLKTSIDRLFHQVTPALVYTMLFYYSNKYQLKINQRD